MKTELSAVVIACLLAPQPGCAAEPTETPRHEVWLGLGGGTSPKQSSFDVPDDLTSELVLLISLGYLFAFDANDAVEFHTRTRTAVTSTQAFWGGRQHRPWVGPSAGASSARTRRRKPR